MSNKIVLHIGDVRDVMAELPDGHADLLVTSPPFWQLRSYLPGDHPEKNREIGAEPTPAAFIDTLYELTAEWRRLVPEWGSICVELGDTLAGSGGGGGDYLDGGLREGQPGFGGSAAAQRAGNAAHWRAKAAQRDAAPESKSMCLIPHLYTIGLAYGHNPLTGGTSPAGRWRVRNVVVWARPNPPVGSLGKRNVERRTGDQKFRPATSYITIACTGTGRYFDLDAVRSDTPRTLHDDGASPGHHALFANGGRHVTGFDHHARGGAPPLDWHTDDLDGDWLWKLATQPFSGWTETVRQVRVPTDAHADGSQRTTSPSCPLHGSLDHQDSNAPDDERGDGSSTRNGHTDARPARAPGDGCPPTSSSTDPTASTEAPADPAATPRSKPSSRTGRAPATTPADTPSDQTAADTGGTPAEPSSDGLSLGTPESSISTVATDAQDGTVDRIPDTAECSCEWYRIESRTERTSHYAVYPITLPRRLVLAMCPQRVCQVCGWPSERIVGAAEYVGHNGHTIPADDPWRTGRGGEVLGLSGGKHPATKAAPTLGWTDCGCSDDGSHWRPGRVLDPFGGSGTTAVAAALEGRDAVLIDIDARNIDLVHRRLTETVRIVDRVDHPDRVEWTVTPAATSELAAIANGQPSLFDPPKEIA